MVKNRVGGWMGRLFMSCWLVFHVDQYLESWDSVGGTACSSFIHWLVQHRSRSFRTAVVVPCADDAATDSVGGINDIFG